VICKAINRVKSSYSSNYSTGLFCSRCDAPQLPPEFPAMPPIVTAFTGGNDKEAFKEWLKSCLRFERWQTHFLRYKKLTTEKGKYQQTGRNN